MRALVLGLVLAACGNPGSSSFDIDAAPCDFADAGVSAISQWGSPNVDPAVTADRRGGVMVAWTVLTEGGLLPQNSFVLSQDDGATFSMPVQLPMSYEGHASVSTDGSGAFYAASLSEMGVFVNRIDAATGFVHLAVRVTPSTSVPNSFANPWIGVHNDGTLVVAFTSQSDGLRVARSTDQGQTFASVVVDSGGALDPRFCLDHNGGATAPLFVIYRGGDAIRLRRSKDGGATWVNLLSALPGAGAHMPRCAVRGDDVWFSVAGGVLETDEILVFHSADGGLTFAPSVRVAENELVLNSALAVTDAGTVVVGYSGVFFGRARFKIAQSSGGSTFTCSTIADIGACDTTSCEVGSAAGLFAGGGRIYAAFADGSTMPSQISFVRLDMP